MFFGGVLLSQSGGVGRAGGVSGHQYSGRPHRYKEVEERRGAEGDFYQTGASRQSSRTHRCPQNWRQDPTGLRCTHNPAYRFTYKPNTCCFLLTECFDNSLF